jgi:transposase-like protein
MIAAVIPARLEFGCGHVALVSLPRVKGEGAAHRTQRVSQEKTAARSRPCDFCGPSELPPLDVRAGQEHTLSGESNGHHVSETKENLMTTTETVEPSETTDPASRPAGSPNVTRLGADEAKRTFPPRRRLGDEQEREVTRLYAETTTPVAQIGQQFGIGESSVYRIAQRNGASLRGRTAPPSTPSATSAEPSSPAAAATPVEAEGETEAPVATPEPAPAPAATPVKATRKARVPRAKPASTPAAASVAAAAPEAEPAPAAPAAAVGGPASTGLRFRIRYNAETVIEAADIRAALTQLDALGATEVQSVTREG